MRSPEELIQELDREAAKFSEVAIVVAFDDTSRFVFHSEDSEKMEEELRAFIEAGGEPFGLLGYIATEKESNVASFVYEEYKDSIWAPPLRSSRRTSSTLSGAFRTALDRPRAS